MSIEPARTAIADTGAALPGTTPSPREPQPFTGPIDRLYSTTGYAGSEAEDVRYYRTAAEAADDPRNIGPTRALWQLDRTTGEWHRLPAHTAAAAPR